MGDTGNPLASASLKRSLDDVAVAEQVPADATGGTAEAIPSNGLGGADNGEEASGSSAKRPKLEGDVSSTPVKSDSRDGARGVAMIKAE
jgi:hypothetical protein